MSQIYTKKNKQTRYVESPFKKMLDQNTDKPWEMTTVRVQRVVFFEW